MYVADFFMSFYVSNTDITNREEKNGFQAEMVAFLFWNESLDTSLKNAF